MEEKVYVIVGGRKKIGKKVVCKLCQKELIVRKHIPHSGYCKNCFCKVVRTGKINSEDLDGYKRDPKYERICYQCGDVRKVYSKVNKPRLCNKCNASTLRKRSGINPRLGTGDPNVKKNRNERENLKRKQTRIKLINFYGNICNRCKQKNLPIHVFQFHHFKPKEYEMASLINRSNWDKIMKEAENCVMLCANCHQIEHYGLESAEFTQGRNH